MRSARAVGTVRVSNSRLTSNKAILFRRSCLSVFLCLLACAWDSNALQLTGTVSPNPVVVGGKLTFTFTVFNDGATPASGTLFTNRLPPSTVFVSAAVTNGVFAISSNVFSYQPDTLPPGGQVVFKLVITPVTTQLITNLAYCVGSDGELVADFSLTSVTSVQAGPNLNVGRIHHQSILLSDGRVLVAGGEVLEADGARATATAEVYSPSNDLFTLVGNMSTRRQSQTVTLLPNGSVLVAGGKSRGVSATSVDLFDPTNNTFIPTTSLGVARASHTATLLANGDVILAGGAGPGTLIERFSLSNGIAAISPAGNLAVPRSGHVAALLSDGRVFFAGGGGEDNPFAEVFDPASGVSTPVAPGGHGVSAVAVTLGKILVHGYTVQPHVLAEVYSIQSNSFVTLTPPADPHFGGNYLTLRSGEVLMTGGLWTFAVDIFNPRTSSFTPSSPVAVTRYDHSAVQLADGRILLTGGNDLIGTMSGDRRSTELYALRLDFDQDGMDDAWELANQLEPSNRNDAVADADDDGHTNLQEYLAGTNPQDPNSVMRIEITQLDASMMRIRFTSALGKLYRLERTTNVLNDVWGIVADNIPGTGTVIEITDALTTGTTGQLYRVRLLP